MRLSSFSFRDIGCHFRKNSGYYYSFIFTIFLALVIGIIIVLSSDGYLSLLVSKNKNLYAYINGSIKFSEMFFNQLLKFTYPIIIILILGLNYYSCRLTYLFIGYQFTIFVMTISAVISVYTFSGIITSLFFIMPINLIYFMCLIFLSIVCLERCYYAKRTRYFKEGYDKYYFLKVILSIIVVVILVLIITLVLPILLKSAIFFIF